MSKLNVYSVFDKKAKCYDALYCFSCDADAVRFFDMLIFSRESKLCKYPEDFDLFRIGYFDPSSGNGLMSLESREFLTSAQDRIIYFDVQKRLREEKVSSELASTSNEGDSTNA